MHKGLAFLALTHSWLHHCRYSSVAGTYSSQKYWALLACMNFRSCHAEGRGREGWRARDRPWVGGAGGVSGVGGVGCRVLGERSEACRVRCE